MTTVTKESQLANMLRTCSEALKQVTAERDAEIERLKETVRVYDKRIVSLGCLAMETGSHKTTRNCGEHLKAEITAQRKVLEQALEALTSIAPMYAAWHIEFPEHVGDKEVQILPLAQAAITAIQGVLK